MHITRSDLINLLITVIGSCIFLGLAVSITRGPEPHPGLKDDALKQALRGDWDHKQLSYLEARKHLWGKVDGNGRHATDVYTGAEIKYLMQPLPYKGAVEHAWPVTRLPAEARSDLHHSFPVSG
ncbi:MAG: hypothetical protein ACNA8W_11465, partial [Bradymonadaceae bacterium]